MQHSIYITELNTFDNQDNHFVLRGNLAIVRNIVQIKERVERTALGDLFYMPQGRVVYVKHGAARIRVNMQHQRLQEGMAMVLPPNCLLEVLEVTADYDAFLVAFGEIPLPQNRWMAWELSGADRERIRMYLDLLWAAAHCDTWREATTDSLLEALLADLDSLTAVPHEPAATATAAERLMHRFYDLLPDVDTVGRSVQAFAQMLCVTPNHLSAVVKQQSGRTVMQLIAAHTVLRAKVMLRHSDLPVGEISNRLDFSDPPAFCHFFRRETGMSPKEYRDSFHGFMEA